VSETPSNALLYFAACFPESELFAANLDAKQSLSPLIAVSKLTNAKITTNTNLTLSRTNTAA
jgi:hypothetical protein